MDARGMVESSMIVYCDANPKMLALVSELGQTLVEVFDSPMTNNEAEYRVVIRALEAYPEVTEIRTDSQLVVEQLNHRWHIKEDRLRELATRFWSHNSNARVVWVPRKQNLAGKALK